MSLADRIKAVLKETPSSVATQVGGVTVWRVDDPAFPSKNLEAEVRACRRALLDAIAEDPENVYLVPADDPEDREIPGSWTRADSSTWLWPADLELDDPATARWLMAVGGWTAYSAPAPVDSQGPNPFKAPPKKLIEWMREAEVDVLVAVFADGVEWVVALA